MEVTPKLDSRSKTQRESKSIRITFLTFIILLRSPLISEKLFFPFIIHNNFFFPSWSVRPLVPLGNGAKSNHILQFPDDLTLYDVDWIGVISRKDKVIGLNCFEYRIKLFWDTVSLVMINLLLQMHMRFSTNSFRNYWLEFWWTAMQSYEFRNPKLPVVWLVETVWVQRRWLFWTQGPLWSMISLLKHWLQVKRKIEFYYWNEF